MRRATTLRRDRRRGAGMIEFTLVGLILYMVIFTMFEVDRLLLVTTALADSARVGVRYAIVHGSDNSATADSIRTVIKNYAKGGFLDPTKLVIPDPTYTPDSSPGSTVFIKVTYPYDPFIGYFPLSGVSLGSTASGIITY